MGGVIPEFPEKFTYKVINVMDSPSENLGKHFLDAAKFISSALKSDGKVLVHCWAGISRSTSCICAYLMLEYGLKVDEAVDICRKKRYIVNPNSGFMR